MMDHSPYRKVAVASTFSPRFEQVLAEAKRIRDRFGSELSLIYVGEKTDQVAGKFKAALEGLALPSGSAIYYEQGEPAGSILQAVEKNGVELLLAGALEK